MALVMLAGGCWHRSVREDIEKMSNPDVLGFEPVFAVI